MFIERIQVQIQAKHNSLAHHLQKEHKRDYSDSNKLRQRYLKKCFKLYLRVAKEVSTHQLSWKKSLI